MTSQLQCDHFIQSSSQYQKQWETSMGLVYLLKISIVTLGQASSSPRRDRRPTSLEEEWALQVRSANLSLFSPFLLTWIPVGLKKVLATRSCVKSPLFFNLDWIQLSQLPFVPPAAIGRYFASSFHATHLTAIRQAKDFLLGQPTDPSKYLLQFCSTSTLNIGHRTAIQRDDSSTHPPIKILTIMVYRDLPLSWTWLDSSRRDWFSWCSQNKRAQESVLTPSVQWTLRDTTKILKEQQPFMSKRLGSGIFQI